MIFRGYFSLAYLSINKGWKILTLYPLVKYTPLFSGSLMIARSCHDLVGCPHREAHAAVVPPRVYLDKLSYGLY